MYAPTLRPVAHPTRVAVLGCGYWGMNYVRVLNELPDAVIAGVCDQRTSRLDEVARRFPGVPLTTDVDEALEDEQTDAAVICTQAATHREIAGRALEAGKHLLVEKPLTVNVADADELIELAERGDRVLLTGHTFLYNEGVKHVKSLIAKGALGRTYYLYATRTNLGPFRSDVNALWDLAPHDIAIFNHLVDAVPRWVSAVGARVLANGREDVGFITLHYGGNVLGHIHVSWADPQKVRQCVVVGSDRRIAFNDLEPVERVRVFDRGVKPDLAEGATTFGEQLQVREGDITSPALAATEPLKHLCGHFLHCVRRGERPVTPGIKGREVVAVMQAVQDSVARHGAPVRVDAAPREREAASRFARALR
ncbi:MAG TPA: Gfo/Idh/MocA family oxidoreductase [Baekduia sp.]|nr:Gfo/Idh/MocA family oxidoreductase [Baekduia sp.]